MRVFLSAAATFFLKLQRDADESCREFDAGYALTFAGQSEGGSADCAAQIEGLAPWALLGMFEANLRAPLHRFAGLA
jgi:hypothetical protein